MVPSLTEKQGVELPASQILQAGLVLKPRGLLVARGAGVGKQVIMSTKRCRSLLFIRVTFVVKDLAE